MKYNPKTISIIGYGRFGQFWAGTLSRYFEVQVFDTKKINTPPQGITIVSYDQVFEADVIIVAVPIARLEKVIKQIATRITPGTTIMDVASVKVHSKRLFARYLKDKQFDLLLTHPMFGPDSAAEGLEGLPIMMHNFEARGAVFAYWKKFFSMLQLRVAVMTPEKHDKYAAKSHSVAQFLGHVFNEIKLTKTPIDTKGFETLLRLKEITCNDSWELFSNLQTYNPYARSTREHIIRSAKAINAKLNKPLKHKGLRIGIQGGKGSFNEEACRDHCEHEGITDFEIIYLYTSERVLQALEKGEIDYGQCAIQNSIGGMVRETVKSLAKHSCDIAFEFEFIVNHCLLVRPGVHKKDIRIIMSHPQALAQCKTTLTKRYPDQLQKSETGKLIDQSLLAKHLGEGKLSRSIAVLAPSICAELYGLKVVGKGLQDLQQNYTTFMWFKR